MKNILKAILIGGALSLGACENGEWDYPDFEYQTVYFAYQYPVRTITLGEDIFDTSLDNQYKCQILATTGGVYENGSDITIDFKVDNSLCDRLAFEGRGADILPMPSEYYTLSSNQLKIASGSLLGGLEVQLTDKFFNDPLALSANYVIPLYMTNVENADSILSGRALVENPNRSISSHWEVVPKDYILYAVKYINKWHGNYLRRGKDVITGKNGNSSLDATIIRHEEYVEYDQVNELNTTSLSSTEFPLVFKDTEGNNIDCTLLLSFDDKGNCSVSSKSDSFTATGSGKFVSKGEKNSWGAKDRDAIYLEYQIELDAMSISTNDTLVLRDRGVGMETFIPVLK